MARRPFLISFSKVSSLFMPAGSNALAPGPEASNAFRRKDSATAMTAASANTRAVGAPLATWADASGDHQLPPAPISSVVRMPATAAMAQRPFWRCTAQQMACQRRSPGAKDDEDAPQPPHTTAATRWWRRASGDRSHSRRLSGGDSARQAAEETGDSEGISDQAHAAGPARSRRPGGCAAAAATRARSSAAAQCPSRARAAASCAGRGTRRAGLEQRLFVCWETHAESRRGTWAPEHPDTCWASARSCCVSARARRSGPRTRGLTTSGGPQR